MIASGTSRKYLTYAVGEIILVMIGILLAIQVNNWNNDRIQKTQARMNLENLVTDLKDDISYFDGSHHTSAFRVNCLKYLLELTGVHTFNLSEKIKSLSDSENLNFDSSDILKLNMEFEWNMTMPDTLNRPLIESCFLWSDRAGIVVINKSAIEEFKSTGLFSSLKNKELKAKINDYYGEMAWMFSEWREQNFREKLDKWTDFLLEKHQINNTNISQVKDPIGLIRNNLNIRLQIENLIEFGLWRENGTYNAKLLAEKLIQDIELELAHYSDK